MARVRRRLIPFLFLLYVVAYLDRVNVGFAALDMNRDLGFSAAVYGLGSGIFFVSYTLLEVPSNLMLARVGAGVWIARIMLTWGLVSAAMAFVWDATTFYVLRFLLGAAEAGFFPGIIYYLTQWFPARERARAVALFMTGTAIAGVVGGPLSSGLLLLDGAWGLRGWQWLFLVEGLPAVLLAPIVWRQLNQLPATAPWLPEDERRWLVETLAAEQVARPDVHDTVRAALDQRPLVGAGGRLLLGRAGHLRRELLAAADPPGAGHGLVGHGGPRLRHSLRRRRGGDGCRRRPFGPHRRTALARGAARRSPARPASRWRPWSPTSLTLSLAALSLAAMGVWGTLGPFWALPTAFLTGRAAAGGVALVNSVANIGGFVGPTLMGYMRDATGTFAAGLWLLAAGLVAGAGDRLLPAAPRRGSRRQHDRTVAR